jgi:hypothetical protein
MANIIRQLERFEKEGKGRTSTMQKRVADCEEVIERARFYAPLLHEVADKMVDKIEAVKARLGGLIDAAAATDDGAVFAKLDEKLAPKQRPARRRRVKRSEAGPSTKKAEPRVDAEPDSELFNI